MREGHNYVEEKIQQEHREGKKDQMKRERGTERRDNRLEEGTDLMKE